MSRSAEATLSVPSTSRAALVTECSPPGAEGILAVCPWHRRRRHELPARERLRRRLANESKLRRDPRWSRRPSTAVAAVRPLRCGPSTSAPCNDLVPERRDRRRARSPSSRSDRSSRWTTRARPSPNATATGAWLRRRTDTRTRSDSSDRDRPPRAPRATRHRASRASRVRSAGGARHPEQTRARVAGAGERPEVVAAAARIASRMCDDKTYVWSNFRFFWTAELETDMYRRSRRSSLLSYQTRNTPR